MPSRLTLIITVVCVVALSPPAQAQWVIDSVSVGGAWVGGMVYNAEYDVVYGVTGSCVFAISCSTNEVVAHIDKRNFSGLAYSPTSRKLYCSFGMDSVLIVSGATHQRLKAIQLSEPNQIVWDSVSNCVYVSRTEDNAVSAIDCATDSVVGSIPTGRGPVRMHLNTLRHKLYVLNHDAESVTIVDLDDHGVIGTIPVIWPPEVGCYSEAVDKFYCGAGDVTVIDGQADSVVRRLTIGSGAGAKSMVAVDSHRVVMVGGCGGINEEDTVFVFDAVSDTLVGALPTVRDPTGMCWSSLTDLVYVTAGLSDRLAVVQGDGSRIRKFFRVGEDPFVLLPVAKHERVYVGHLGGRHVYVVRDRAGGIAEVAGAPSWIDRVPATLVCDVLRIPHGDGWSARGAVLLDAAGRKRLDLIPGVNRLVGLEAGVYIVMAGGRPRMKLVKLD